MTDSPTTDLLTAIRDGLGATVPFAAHTGVEIVDVTDGAATAVLPDAPHRLNHVATVHAGALFTLAEAASGAAMAGAFAPVLFEIRPVVSDAAIEYRRPARGEIRAVASMDDDGPTLRARLASDGRVDTRATVTLHDGTDREVATFRATWVVRRPATT